jgi:phage portal protein BeeE
LCSTACCRTLKRWEAAIARDLIVDDERYFAEHSVSGLLRGDHTSRASYYVSALQNGWMTINEVRELENLNPIDGGDVHFVPDEHADARADDRGAGTGTRARATAAARAAG